MRVYEGHVLRRDYGPEMGESNRSGCFKLLGMGYDDFLRISDIASDNVDVDSLSR
jgi:hypothetical protein